MFSWWDDLLRHSTHTHTFLLCCSNGIVDFVVVGARQLECIADQSVILFASINWPTHDDFLFSYFIVFSRMELKCTQCVYYTWWQYFFTDNANAVYHRICICWGVMRESQQRMRAYAFGLMDLGCARPHRLCTFVRFFFLLSFPKWALASNGVSVQTVILLTILTRMIDQRLISIRHRLNFHQRFIIFRTNNHICFMHLSIYCFNFDSYKNEILKLQRQL